MNTLMEALQARKDALVLADSIKRSIAENGWKKDGGYDDKGRCCLVNTTRDIIDKMFIETGGSVCKDALYAAMTEDPILRKRVKYDMVKFDMTMVIEFNDHPDTTLADINDLLDRTKVRLERSIRA